MRAVLEIASVERGERVEPNSRSAPSNCFSSDLLILPIGIIQRKGILPIELCVCVCMGACIGRDPKLIICLAPYKPQKISGIMTQPKVINVV